MIPMDAVEPNREVIARDPVPPALRRFIWDIQSMVELAESEREILLIGRDLMARLIATDDWLPTVFAAANPAGGQQFELFRDALERFSIVSTVLGGGADVTISQPCVWEIAGVLRGAVDRQQLEGNAAMAGVPRLQARAVAARASGSGDVLQLCNALQDRTSIVIHVYGGDIAQVSRRSGASAQTMRYANAECAPPYDIFSIQHEIKD